MQRSWCNCVFLLVSYQCSTLANGSRESSLSWDNASFPFAVGGVTGKCNVKNHFGLEWQGEWLHQGQGDMVTSDTGQQMDINDRNNCHGSYKELMWYERENGKEAVFKVPLFKESGYTFKRSVLETEGPVMSKEKKKKHQSCFLAPSLYRQMGFFFSRCMQKFAFVLVSPTVVGEIIKFIAGGPNNYQINWRA